MGWLWQIVYLSQDENEQKFHEYFQTMPWLSLPFNESRTLLRELMVQLEVSQVPTLVLVDEEGKVITTTGTNYVMKDPEGARFPWGPQPVNDLSFSYDGLDKSPCVVVLMEGASAETHKSVEEALERVSRDHQAATASVAAADKDGDDEVSNKCGFYFAKEATLIAQRLRQLMGLEASAKEKFLLSEEEANRPVLVVVDLEKGVRVTTL
jgi:hypothetical protein